MIFEQISIGGDRNFAYLVGDKAGAQAAVVDPGYNAALIQQRLAAHGLSLAYLVATHSHYDHVDAMGDLQSRAGGGQVVAHRSAALPVAVDRPVDDGDVIELGAVRIRIIHCPGHSPDSIGLLVDETKLISGDELFVGKVGGTGSEDQARTQYDSLHGRLMTLDDAVEVWPGHDVGVRPSSTIGHERRTNPFLLRESFEDFLWLKRNWAQYKKEQGIQ